MLGRVIDQRNQKTSELLHMVEKYDELLEKFKNLSKDSDEKIKNLLSELEEKKK